MAGLRAGLFSLAAVLGLTGSSVWAADVVISEFMAVNQETIADEDGDFSDWLELANVGVGSVNLDGWYLTDNASSLRKWACPGVTLGAGEYLLIFASGKDRTDPAGELHTNFRLAASGEYLAVIMPDGITVAHEFEPEYPQQYEDFSYGFARKVSRLITEGAATRTWVPTNGTAGLSWTVPGFNDALWDTGPTGVGYDVDGGGGAPPGEAENVAPGGIAIQSSECFSCPAQIAIDGDYGNFTHTCSDDPGAWWQLDLQGTFFIDTIVLHNRMSCCGSRLRDITVSILDEEGTTTVFESELLNPENAGYSYPNGPPQITIDLVTLTGGTVSGGVVRVERAPDSDLSGTGGQGNTDEPNVLSLGEVEVFASAVPPGYGSLIGTDVEAVMHGVNASAYIRIPFEVADPGVFESLMLRMKYDDGYVAYLNGTEVARRNAPGTPAWSSAATAERTDADAFHFEDVSLSGFIEVLEPGLNVLAVHGLNLTLDDGDFLIVPELIAVWAFQEEVRYFRTPTPGTVNDSSSAVGFVEDTTFSRDRGFYTAPFSLEIATETDGAQIRYTLDGTAPSESHGFLYDGPLWITGTTVVRAIAYTSGLEPTNVDTQTYIFLDDVVRQDYQATLDAGFPSSWGDTSPDYGMDPDVIGQEGQDRYNGRYATTIKDDLLSLPTMSIAMNIDEMLGPNGIYTNSTNRGLAWERACSVELFYPHGGADFQADAGVRIQGGAFRSHSLTKKHSLRLLFKKAYGVSKLRYPLFGPGAPDRFDTITLRAGANDGYAWSAARLTEQYTRDEFGRSLQIASGNAGSHGLFVHLYINGVYWGLYNPVERPDETFGATYYGGEEEDWDALSHGGVTNGDANAFEAMVLQTAAAQSSLAEYMKLQGCNPDGTHNPAYPHLLDVPQYVDYLVVNVWGGNWDWPWKNWWANRDRTENSTGFKFYCWDYENTMGNNRDRSPLTMNALGNNFTDGAGEPHNNLKNNPEYRMLFADRAHRFLFNGGILTPASLIPRYQVMADGIERAMVAESARWGDTHHATPLTLQEWLNERDWLLATYLPQRTDIVIQQLRSASPPLYPSVEAPTFNRHGGIISPGFVLTMQAPDGIVYYTLDGSDPRLVGGAVSPAAREAGSATLVTLIDAGAEARVLVPQNDNLGLTWTGVDFDDSAWISGQTGVGYDRDSDYDSLIETDLESELYGQRSGVYLRMRFFVTDPSAYTSLTLRMKYDDGYVAYLNGDFVESRNAPPAPTGDSSANASRSDTEAVLYESVDIGQAADVLRTGWNVLALHGLNSSSASGDMLIVPRLDASELTEESGVVLEATTLVRARARAGGQWSALNEARFRIMRPLDYLKITEIMYNPRDNGTIDGDVYEFIELKNTGPSVLDLTEVSITDAIRYTFAEGTVALPGDIFVIPADSDAFADRYPGVALFAGNYAGNLSNSGETVVIRGPDGTVVTAVSYDDVPPWPVDADGFGASLVPVDPGGIADPDSPSQWRASANLDGSPGEDDPGSAAPGGLQRPGDFNQDGGLDISDAVAYLVYQFGAGSAGLPCGGTDPSEGADRLLLDLNGDSAVDLADPIHLLSYLFGGGPPPVLGTDCVRIPGCPTMCFP